MSIAISKRRKALEKMTEKGKVYSIREAIAFLKASPKTKFDQSVELQLKLGVDLQANDQVVRGTSVLPHGQGKKIRVIVFTKDESGKAAKEAGADFVGGDDLVEKVMGGWMDFDVAVATPSMMKEIAKLGKVLGPRGLMPTPKAGTVTSDVGKAVKEVKAGKIEFKVDKSGVVNAAIGKLSFSSENLMENAQSLLSAISRSRPATAKGIFFKSLAISSTMGPGLKIDVNSLSNVQGAKES